MKLIYMFEDTPQVSVVVAGWKTAHSGLKQRLFPRHLPTDRQFNAHMMALASRTYDPTLTNREVLQVLQDRGHLLVEED